MIETEFEVGKLKVKIEPDPYPRSPREDVDHLGTMVCFHKRYNLGDKTELCHQDRSWGELQDVLVKNYDAAFLLPLYLYDHSGLRIKVGSFEGLLPGGHAEFDSGQVGFIFASKEKIRKEYGVKRLTSAVVAKARKVMCGEVEEYDQFLRGDVWTYVVEGPDGEVLESCCGFYGFEYCKKEAESAAKGCLKFVEEEAVKINNCLAL